MLKIDIFFTLTNSSEKKVHETEYVHKIVKVPRTVEKIIRVPVQEHPAVETRVIQRPSYQLVHPPRMSVFNPPGVELPNYEYEEDGSSAHHGSGYHSNGRQAGLNVE